MKSNNPLVSILTTNYNGEEFIHDAVTSVLNQTYTNWELIIIENGSIDNSINEIAKFKDSRIKLYKFEKNIGRTNALIQAANFSTGEYICILDIDDTFEISKINSQLDFLLNHPNVVLLGTSYNLINKKNNLINTVIIPNNKYVFPNTFTYLNPIAHSSVMFRRTSYQYVNGYDNSFIFAQDFDLWIKLSEIGEISFLDIPLTNIRLTSTSMSNDISQIDLRLNEVVENLKKLDLRNHKIEILNRKLNILLNREDKSYMQILKIIFKKVINKYL
jgi:glycosyltransferase involved in cell wall biosynthesis